MKLIKWTKTLQYIVQDYTRTQKKYEQEIKYLRARQRELDDLIKERTDIHVDIAASSRQPNTVIVCGRYRNTDYVRVFGVQGSPFEELIHILKDMERHGKVRHVDEPIAMRGAFKRIDW